MENRWSWIWSYSNVIILSLSLEKKSLSPSSWRMSNLFCNLPIDTHFPENVVDFEKFYSVTMLFTLTQQSQNQNHFWFRQFVTCLFWWCKACLLEEEILQLNSLLCKLFFCRGICLLQIVVYNLTFLSERSPAFSLIEISPVWTFWFLFFYLFFLFLHQS